MTPAPAAPQDTAPQQQPIALPANAFGTDTSELAAKGGYHNPSAFDGVNRDVADRAKALLTYTTPATPYMFARDPLTKAAAGLITSRGIDPSWNPGNYELRQKVKQSFTSGADATGLKSLNQTIYHLGDLKDQVPELNNASGFLSTAVRNPIENWWATANGDKRPGTFQETADAAANELVRALRGTGGNEADIQEWRKNLPVNGSPEQQNGQIDKAIDILSGAVSAYRQKYTKGIGKPPVDFPFIDDRGRRILTQMGIDPDKIEVGMSAKEARAEAKKPTAAPTPSTPHHVIAIEGRHYQYNGTGATDDLKNYTEVKP